MKKKPFHISDVTNNSRFLVASMAVSSALILSRPILPAIAYAVDANKYTWTKQELNLIGGESFNYVALSATGKYQITSSMHPSANQQTKLSVSHDFGASWQSVAEGVAPTVYDQWSSVDVSNDGQTMVAISRGGFDTEAEEGEQSVPGKIIISHDAGTNWSDITPESLQGGENKVLVSDDGSTIVATGGVQLFISDDGGTNWETPEIVQIDDEFDDFRVWSVSMSDDGDKLLISNIGSGSEFARFYLSEDGGGNWSGIDTPGEEPLFYGQTALSADGSKMIVAGSNFEGGENDYVYTSSDDGETWTDITPDDVDWNIWSSVDMSDSGDKIAMLGYRYGGENTTMYTSADAGNSWALESTDDSNNGSIYDYLFSSVDLNSSGTRAIVGRTGGIYTGVLKNTPASLAGAEGGKQISITTPDGTVITCSTALKESAQTTQDGTYDYPLGLVHFCFDTDTQENQVSLTFVTDLKPNQVVARKYNSTTQTYFDIPSAVISETTLEGQHALMVSYTITDNGQLDLDPTSGKIIDPVGLATLSAQLAETGDNANLLAVIAFITTIGSAVVLGRRRYSQN